MKEIHSAVPTQAVDNGSLETHIATVIDEQRRFFYSNVTKDVPFRITQLKKLKRAIEQREKDLLDALKTDLNKHPFEGYGTEVGLVVKEIDNTIANLANWTKPQKVGTPLFFFKANSYVQHEPYGSVLIIGPWNYPAQLIFLPLIAAIAAGNCAVVKPSEMAPATAAVVSELIGQTFDAAYVAVFEGNEKVAQGLLHHRFDLVFFTGSTAVGRLVYQAAAKHLTPVVLELGGKSPCIVNKNVDLPLTAKQIIWGKLVNAGQTCIAPDYLLVHEIGERVLYCGNEKTHSPIFWFRRGQKFALRPHHQYPPL